MSTPTTLAVKKTPPQATNRKVILKANDVVPVIVPKKPAPALSLEDPKADVVNLLSKTKVKANLTVKFTKDPKMIKDSEMEKFQSFTSRVGDPRYSTAASRRLILETSEYFGPNVQTSSSTEKKKAEDKVLGYWEDHKSVYGFYQWNESLCPPLRCLGGKRVQKIVSEGEKEGEKMSFHYTLEELFEPDSATPNTRFTEFDPIDGLVKGCESLDKCNSTQSNYDKIRDSVRSKYLADYAIVEDYCFTEYSKWTEILGTDSDYGNDQKTAEIRQTLKVTMFLYFYYTRKQLFSVNRENLSLETLVKFTAMDPCVLLKDYQHFLQELLNDTSVSDEPEDTETIVGHIYSSDFKPDPIVKSKYPTLSTKMVERLVSIIVNKEARGGSQVWAEDFDLMNPSLYEHGGIRGNKDNHRFYSLFRLLYRMHRNFVVKKAFLVSIRRILQSEANVASNPSSMKKCVTSEESWLMAPKDLLSYGNQKGVPKKSFVYSLTDSDEDYFALPKCAEQRVNEYRAYPKFFPMFRNGHPISTLFEAATTNLASTLGNKFRLKGIEKKAALMSERMKAQLSTKQPPPNTKPSKEEQIRKREEIKERNASKRALQTTFFIHKWLTEQTKQNARTAGFRDDLVSSTELPIRALEVKLTVHLCQNYLNNSLLLFESKENYVLGLNCLPYPPVEKVTTKKEEEKVKKSKAPKVATSKTFNLFNTGGNTTTTSSVDSDLYSRHSSASEAEDYFNVNESEEHEDSEDESFECFDSDEEKVAKMSANAFGFGYVNEEDEVGDMADLALKIDKACASAEYEKLLEQKQRREKRARAAERAHMRQLRKENGSSDSDSLSGPLRRSARTRFAPNRFEITIEEDDELASVRLLQQTRDQLERREQTREDFNERRNLIDSEGWIEDHKKIVFDEKKEPKKRKLLDLTPLEKEEGGEEEPVLVVTPAPKKRKLIPSKPTNTLSFVRGNSTTTINYNDDSIPFAECVLVNTTKTPSSIVVTRKIQPSPTFKLIPKKLVGGRHDKFAKIDTTTTNLRETLFGTKKAEALPIQSFDFEESL